MKRILLIKTSSLGDIIHNFPAVTDLAKEFPSSRIDWVVEEGYSFLPQLHLHINNVIPIAIRRWRKMRNLRRNFSEIRNFLKQLRKVKYDTVIDSQGLLKSAILCPIARGTTHGLDISSAKEPVSLIYNKTYRVDKRYHAIERNRTLYGDSLGYEVCGRPCYDLNLTTLRNHEITLPPKPFAILIAFSSKADKSWSSQNWVALGNKINKFGIKTIFLAGNNPDQSCANLISNQILNSEVFPISSLHTISVLMSHAKLVVGLDTGLTHLAAAFGKPTVGIFCSTDPSKTGVCGGLRKTLNYGNIDVQPDIETVWSGLLDIGIED